MSLVKSQLENQLKQAFQNENWDDASAAIASAIDSYIKSATVTVPASGLLSPPGVSGGPVTGQATGTIS